MKWKLKFKTFVNQQGKKMKKGKKKEDLKNSGFLYIKQELVCLSVSLLIIIIILSFFLFYTGSSLGQIKFIYVH